MDNSLLCSAPLFLTSPSFRILLFLCFAASLGTVELTYDCEVDAGGTKMVPVGCQKQIETSDFLKRYDAALSSYESEVSKYNLIAQSPFLCSHPSTRYCDLLEFYSLKKSALLVERKQKKLEELLVHAAEEATLRCPQNKALISRYSKMWNLIESGGQPLRSFSETNFSGNLPWTVPGIILSFSICVFAAIIFIMAIFGRTFLLYPQFTMIVVLSFVTSFFRVTWYTLSLFQSSLISLQITARIALIFFTVLLAVFSYAWGSAVAEAITKQGVIESWKRHILVLLLVSIVLISGIYAISMAAVTALLASPIYDASPLVLPLVQLIIAVSLTTFVLLARREILQNSADSISTKKRSSASPSNQSQVIAIRFQTIVAFIILAVVILHVIIAFVAEFTKRLNPSAEFLLRFLFVETVSLTVLLVCMFIALRPRKKNKMGYVPLDQHDDPNAIPEQYEA